MGKKKESKPHLGESEPEKVDAYLRQFNHPLVAVVGFLRKEMLSVDPQIGEGIYWNAPTFFYTGSMLPFESKTYGRYLTGFVFNRQDCLRLVFLKGAFVEDPDHVLEGDYKDGRRLMSIYDLADAKRKLPALKKILLNLIVNLRENN